MVPTLASPKCGGTWKAYIMDGPPAAKSLPWQGRSVLRVKGTLAPNPVPSVGVKPRIGPNAIDMDWRYGATRAAMTVTPTNRTLGASVKRGWRLTASAAERRLHGTECVRTYNDASYVSVPEPMAYVARKTNKRVIETDRL